MIFGILRGWFLGLWRARGGGFYGLGYVITFVSLETRTLSGDLGGSSSVSGFIAGQMIQYVLRFSVESFINGFLAFLWPFYALQWLGAWGVLALVGGYFGFEHGVRPWIESRFPELRAAKTDKKKGEESDISC